MAFGGSSQAPIPLNSTGRLHLAAVALTIWQSRLPHFLGRINPPTRSHLRKHRLQHPQLAPFLAPIGLLTPQDKVALVVEATRLIEEDSRRNAHQLQDGITIAVLGDLMASTTVL